ncbi:MAG: AraC family transcriptional regulator, partial [Bacteroidales bacterium]|nr:AraC family transcriptional regulator [Candidatus Cryptobacteroides equifaecalis]
PEDLSYGMRPYKAEKGSIIAVAPGQIGGREDDGSILSFSGWALLWSPELIHDTDLGDKIKDFHYFSYFATDPLKMTDAEWNHITLLVEQFRAELQYNEDSPTTRDVILGYLRLIMEYCNRIYLRQMEVPQSKDRDILKKFNYLLEEFYQTEQQMKHGVPSVAYFAGKLAYSPRYFGDIVHQATGGTAIGYIHRFVVDQGKNLLMKGYSISETAFRLGFEYPHHFTRIFKKVSGMTPREFTGTE